MLKDVDDITWLAAKQLCLAVQEMLIVGVATVIAAATKWIAELTTAIAAQAICLAEIAMCFAAQATVIAAGAKCFAVLATVIAAGVNCFAVLVECIAAVLLPSLLVVCTPCCPYLHAAHTTRAESGLRN